MGHDAGAVRARPLGLPVAVGELPHPRGDHDRRRRAARRVRTRGPATGVGPRDAACSRGPGGSPTDELPSAIEEFVREEAGREGTSVVIGPPGVPGAVPASETKGLEFDAVLVVEPERIIADGPRGAAELYVALTRATQRLGVLHQGPLPQALTGLSEKSHAPPCLPRLQDEERTTDEHSTRGDRQPTRRADPGRRRRRADRPVLPRITGIGRRRTRSGRGSTPDQTPCWPRRRPSSTTSWPATGRISTCRPRCAATICSAGSGTG